MKQFLSLFFIGIILLFVPIWANESPPLDHDQIDKLFSPWDKPDSPGCAIGIYHNGVIVYENGYGSANLDYDKPITPETVFYIVENRALSYQPDNENKFKLSYLTNFEGVGPGGLYTTVGDLYLWDQNYYNNRLTRSPNFHELMHTRGVLSNGDTLDYAFGLRFDKYKGLNIVGHGGSFMGFRAHYERIPEHNYAHTILCNLGSINPGNISRKIIDLYLRDIIEEYLNTFTGTYRNTEYEVNCNIIVKEGDIFISDHSLLEGAWEYSEVDAFRKGGWELEFIRDSQNKVTGFMLTTNRARNIYFEKI